MESVCWGNSTVGSNPTLSAIFGLSSKFIERKDLPLAVTKDRRAKHTSFRPFSNDGQSRPPGDSKAQFKIRLRHPPNQMEERTGRAGSCKSINCPLNKTRVHFTPCLVLRHSMSRNSASEHATLALSDGAPSARAAYDVLRSKLLGIRCRRR